MPYRTVTVEMLKNIVLCVSDSSLLASVCSVRMANADRSGGKNTLKNRNELQRKHENQWERSEDISGK